MMKVKKLKRKCSVRGCKNVANVYALSKTREMGNSVIMCSDCMKEALQSIKELDVTLSSVAETEEPKPQEVIEDAIEETPISVAEDTVYIQKDEEPKKTATATNTNNKTNKKK